MDITLCHEQPDADADEVEARVKAIAAADPNAGGFEIRNENGLISWRLLPLDRADRPKCGATCKSTRRPCRAPVAVKANGDLSARCRRHGGLSTGPQTANGRAAISAANSRRKGTRYKNTITGLPAARFAADIKAAAAADRRRWQTPDVSQPPTDAAPDAATPPDIAAAHYPMSPDVAAQMREMAQRELDRRAQLEADANGGQ